MMSYSQASPDPLASFYTVNPAADLASKAAAGPSASGSSPAPSSYLDVQTQAQPELSEEPARQVGGNMSPARPSQSSTPQDTDARWVVFAILIARKLYSFLGLQL